MNEMSVFTPFPNDPICALLTVYIYIYIYTHTHTHTNTGKAVPLEADSGPVGSRKVVRLSETCTHVC